MASQASRQISDNLGWALLGQQRFADIRLMIWEALLCDFPSPESPSWDTSEPQLSGPESADPDNNDGEYVAHGTYIPIRSMMEHRRPFFEILWYTNPIVREEALEVFLKKAQL